MSKTQITANTELEARDALNRLYNGRDIISIENGCDATVIYHASRDFAAQVNYYTEDERDMINPGLTVEFVGPDCDGPQPPRNLDQDLAIEFLTDCQYNNHTAYFVER